MGAKIRDGERKENSNCTQIDRMTQVAGFEDIRTKEHILLKLQIHLINADFLGSAGDIKRAGCEASP